MSYHVGFNSWNGTIASLSRITTIAIFEGTVVGSELAPTALGGAINTFPYTPEMYA